MRTSDSRWVLGIVAGLIIGTSAGAARADWPPTGAPVAPTRFDQEYPFTMATDGAGGIFVSWFNYTLNSSRLTHEGEVAPGWPSAGLSYGGDSYYNITNLPDAEGGMYEIFNAKDCVAHCGVDPSERRVLRLTAEGALSAGWPAQGVPVGGGYGPIGFGAGDAGKTAAIADGRGGLIVAWGRYTGYHRQDPVELRIQRMDGAGTRAWGDSGRLVRDASARFPLATVAPDGRGGAILFWADERAPHLYAQRLSPEGALLWSASGIPVASDSISAFARPVAIEDGSRGAIIAWFGSAGRDTGIFAVRITAGGGLPWGDPVRVLAASSGIDWLQLVPGRNGDAFLAWRDARVPENESIHAQRLGHGGRTDWAPGGLPVSVAPGHKNYLAACSDDQGGIYLAWGDTRPAGEVFATHLDDSGQPVPGWDVDGTPVCPPVAAVWAVQIVGDGAGNAVVAWTDDRLVTPGLPFKVTQAMRLLPNGPVTRVAGPGRGVRPARDVPQPGCERRVDRLLAAGCEACDVGTLRRFRSEALVPRGGCARRGRAHRLARRQSLAAARGLPGEAGARGSGRDLATGHREVRSQQPREPGPPRRVCSIHPLRNGWNIHMPRGM
jgi:hypothetical protein